MLPRTGPGINSVRAQQIEASFRRTQANATTVLAETEAEPTQGRNVSPLGLRRATVIVLEDSSCRKLSFENPHGLVDKILLVAIREQFTNDSQLGEAQGHAQLRDSRRDISRTPADRVVEGA